MPDCLDSVESLPPGWSYICNTECWYKAPGYPAATFSPLTVHNKSAGGLLPAVDYLRIERGNFVMFCHSLTSAVTGDVHLLSHLVTVTMLFNISLNSHLQVTPPGVKALYLVTVGLLDHHHDGLQCCNKLFVA